MISPRSRRYVLLLLGVLVLSGCGLANPYVVRPDTDPRQRLCANRSDCTVSEAKGSAYELASLYRKKLSDHARMESAVGAGGIVLGAAVLALAAADAHADAFKAAGVIGAATYGLNTWYSNKPRETIYAKGMVALSCAASAVRSVDLPVGERNKLMRTTGAMAAIYKVQSATQSLISVLDQNLGTVEERAKASAMIEQAQTDIVAAVASLDSAAKLDSAASSAGNVLMDSIDAIGAAVDEALQKTVPEGTLGIKIGNSLGAIAATIVPGWDVKVAMPKAKIALAQGKTVSNSISAELLSLTNSLAGLQIELAPIRGVLANFGGSSVSAALDACKVLGMMALSVAPAQVSFTFGAVATASVVIDHGKPPYSATSIGASAPGLELKNPLPFDRRLDVSIAATTPVGIHTVLVSDANGNHASLVVEVKKVPAADTPAAVGKADDTTKKQVTLTPASLVVAMNLELKEKSLVGGKYVIESFTQAGKIITLKFKGVSRINSADKDAVENEIDQLAVLNKPVNQQLKALGLALELPQ